jgi:CDP-glycerol glycerophosphotransferase
VRRFTFATGNLRKVLALPLYGLGALVTVFVPRTNNLWVFGSGSGVGEGALALFKYARTANPTLKLVWLARNARDLETATKLGFETVLASSAQGFWLTVRARVVVLTHGFGDANRFGTRGAFIVQLWHGIPYKHVHLDSAATLRVPVLSRFGFVRRGMRKAYLQSASAIRLFSTASPFSAARIQTAFGLPTGRIVITGDPRDDIITTETRDEARALIADRLGASALPDRILMYAPTWRDGELDPAIPTATDWKRIQAYVTATKSLLIVRSHPLGAGDYSAGLSDNIRMLGADLQTDVNPVLPGVDVLITDYSSIAFDYSLTGGEIVYLAPDVNDYNDTRGAYEPYRDFSGGTDVGDWPAAIEVLERADGDTKFRKQLLAHTDWLAHRVHSFRDGQNTARVYAAILARLSGDDSPISVPFGLAVDALNITAEPSPSLVIGGPVGGPVPATVTLMGTRLALPGKVTVSGRRWTATVPLLSTRWKSTPLPPPSGIYRVRVADADDRPIDLNVSAAIPSGLLRPGQFRASFTSTSTLNVTFTAPLTDTELGQDNQSRLESRYRAASAPLEDSVFLESYYGRNVSSNPRGIDRALSALRPEVARYWSVADASVEVPDGAIAVVEGSTAWWDARASARLLIVNDWLRKRYRKRTGQSVLQTWHGTPLKKIALDRKGVRLPAAIATRRERARWDLMLAQNDFSAAAFRSSYVFRGPIWQEGYPRNDILLTGDAAAVRARLGISTQAKVVLYAPTWRDDRPGKVDLLDVAAFSEALGAGYVTLIRGHSRTMQPGTDVVAAGVLDVTTYPDISELFLVADALITDYSSVMFDFSVTGKPLYFYVPDLDHYRDEVRGFYFDLLDTAPGPVLTDPDRLAASILHPDPAAYEARYAAWRERFNPRDDGHAGNRVVDRLTVEGFL